jgi:hypothetical protein
VTRPKGKKPPLPTAVPPPEVSGDDRALLIDAYKTGLIISWRLDVERGYCLTRGGRPDEYVEVGRLPKFLEGLRAT